MHWLRKACTRSPTLTTTAWPSPTATHESVGTQATGPTRTRTSGGPDRAAMPKPSGDRGRALERRLRQAQLVRLEALGRAGNADGGDRLARHVPDRCRHRDHSHLGFAAVDGVPASARLSEVFAKHGEVDDRVRRLGL